MTDDPATDDAGSLPGDLSEEQAYEQLQCYTLAHGGPEFVHQHVVDAWTAQSADERTKAIAIVFALVGLYLHTEHGYSGRHVQRVHMALGRYRRDWPALQLPDERGAVTARQVMAAPPGAARDRAIDAWCASVWRAFEGNRGAVDGLLRDQRIL